MPPSQTRADPRPLADRLAGYGCTDFIQLDAKLSTATQLDYLDLLPSRSNQVAPLTAVAEHQGAALLYVLDACSDARSDAASINLVQRQLANRSDPAWLGVVKPGSLEVFPIGFHEPANARPVATIDERSPTAPLFFQGLVHGTFVENQRLRGTDYVFRKIFELLTQTTNEFVPQSGRGRLDPLEVLSMAGRALFFRFLIDRRIVLENELSGPNGICPAADELKDAFSTAEKAAQTSSWLDATFNGDFLPLIDESIPHHERAARQSAYLRFYHRTERLVGKKIFAHLHAILRGWRAVGGGFQTEIDWGDFDFAHIPVGVLSQVYESFSHRADPRTARDTSVHYTPRTIARLMVDEAFAAVSDATNPKVLDSSCGAGMFLVLAFRRLIRDRWQNGERPKTSAIQDVLYNQIRGFDISESALRLAALALYITAIELNASPRPPQALKFPRNLRGEVLHRFGNGKDQSNTAIVFPLGSLGPEVPKHFHNAFDIVIGNPPWTRLRDEKEEGDGKATRKRESASTALNAEFTAIGRRVLAARGFVDLAEHYENPDKNPDLPFLWRAMEWAKENGVIALAMPARLLGRTTGKGRQALSAIVRSVEVTGIINGANLRKTAVWEGVDIPFCVLFARNRVPRNGACFFYAAPHFEPSINGDGRFRIDYESAQPISAASVDKQPWLLKTLSLGTWLDVAILSTLTSPGRKTLADFWAESDPKGDRTGQGYNGSPNLTQTFVDFLADLPVFQKPADGFLIEHNRLKTYGERFGTNKRGQSSAHMPRRKELYKPPLVIIPQSPGDIRTSPRAYLSDQAVAFSQSYYGYSCAGHSEAESLAALLYLLPHSTLFEYFCLMTSRRSGFDRQTFNKEEFDALPFPEVSALSASTKSTIRSLAQRLQRNARKPFREIDEFIFSLYGLDSDAVQVAEDTLFSAASYRRAGQIALSCTSHGTRAPFMQALAEALEPYFDVCGEHVAVREAMFQDHQPHEPWFFLNISREAESFQLSPGLIRQAVEIANQRACSRIMVGAPRRKGLLLGLLNQRRWWTITRARLCAQYIIRERLGDCGLPEAT